MKNKKPKTNYEKFFWSYGYQNVVGIDEAGVAPLAGPVVAAAVVLKPGTTLRQIPKTRDSKLLSKKDREKLFYKIIEVCQEHAVGLATPEEIDSFNIHQATRLAMQRAVEKLSQADILLIDGPYAIPKFKKGQLAVIDGDAKIASIAAASIIAKFTRDSFMVDLSRRYPLYGLEKHKGYPTKTHINILKKVGPTPIHRQSFLTNILQQKLF